MVRQHFQRGGNLNTNYIDFAVAGGRRLLTITPEGIGGIGTDVLWAVAYVPTYSYTPSPVTLSTISGIASGAGQPSFISNLVFSESFRTTARPLNDRAGGLWPYFRVFDNNLPSGHSDSAKVRTLPTGWTSGTGYRLYGWLFNEAGRYRIRGTLAAQNRFSTFVDISLIKYIGGTGTGDETLITTRASSSIPHTPVDVTSNFEVGDLLMVYVKVALAAYGGVSADLAIEQTPSIPGYTAP